MILIPAPGAESAELVSANMQCRFPVCRLTAFREILITSADGSALELNPVGLTGGRRRRLVFRSRPRR